MPTEECVAEFVSAADDDDADAVAVESVAGLNREALAVGRAASTESASSQSHPRTLCIRPYQDGPACDDVVAYVEPSLPRMVNNEMLDEMDASDQEADPQLDTKPTNGVLPESRPSPTTTSPTTDSLLSTSLDDDPDANHRLSPTSLFCSVPLSRDVQSIIDTFPKTDPERKKASARKLPCLYCERTFVADSLRLKHVERCHSAKQARRSSSRFQQQLPSPSPGNGSTSLQTLQCMYCNAFQLNDNNLNELFQHLLGEHSDRYFACAPCHERFTTRTHLEEHREEVHPRLILSASSSYSNETTLLEDLFKMKSLIPSSSKVRSKTEDEEVFEPKELRSKRFKNTSNKLGIKRSARLQGKESSNQSGASGRQQKRRQLKNSKPSEGGDGVVERETLKVGPHENPYPSFDAYYRVKKITDHSIDNLRITSLTFNDVFDQAFYTRIKCNIADNLMNHIDGKLFKNEESETRISHFEKTVQSESVVPGKGDANYGCEISLNAATPVVSFLAPQLGDDPEAQIEYGSKASKKKTKPDEVHYKYFTRRKYQASIQEIKENRDLSKLDMWTQYVVKNRQQSIANLARTDKERQEYRKGDEYKAKKANEELNRILDRRGPFEDLKEEANKQAVLDGNARREARVEVSSLLEEMLRDVFEMSRREHAGDGKTELTDAEIPEYLSLRKASLNGESYVDRSDKITLICSSEETENFEAPQVSPRDKNSLVELTGEWTRSRLFICAACGLKLGNMRALLDHKNFVHSNVWCHHYEFVGNQGAYYKHLSIPGLGKMEQLEAHPMAKSWLRSSARLCTKCKKQCNSLGELHRHILECGEDWTWMLIRKKCKYRPFGAKTRRKRRGLFKRQISKEKTDDETIKQKKNKKRYDGPRVKPSDAETIQRMLANLPAKRATRKVMSLKDGFPRNTRKKPGPKNEKQENASNSVPRSEQQRQHLQDSKLAKRKMIAAHTNKCNPVGNLRKSVRNLNKVISSALMDTNIMVRRKVKALHAQRVAKVKQEQQQQQQNQVLLEPPTELTEEQRAEEVKKKISLLKKAQNLRRSVIKRRTTKRNTPDTTDATIEGVVGASNPRKTRSALSSGEGGRSNGDVGDGKPPARKKVCKGLGLGSKLIRNISVRLKASKGKDAGMRAQEQVDGEGNKRKSKFSNIKEAVKKLKTSNKKTSDSKPEVIKELKPPEEAGTEKKVEEEVKVNADAPNDHFLEESNRADATRTISEHASDEPRDNDNRPLDNTPASDNKDKIVTEDSLHRDANSDSDKTANSVSIVANVNAVVAEVKDEPEPINLICRRNDQNPPQGPPPKVDNVAIAPVSNDANLKMKAKKLCKRTKGLNDCIAMLTSKLKCTISADKPPEPVTVVPSFNDEVQQVQQPHDTTTEEQNVVIPEDTVSVSLESAKEPETAPPPLPPKDADIKAPPIMEDEVQTATAITITPVIEQDKENIELEQKCLPQVKQTFDIIDDVDALIKCLDDINAKDIRNGNLDAINVLNHHQTGVTNGLLTKGKSKRQTKKIGSSRRVPKRISESPLVVQEALTHMRIEQIVSGFDRKIGSRRSLPQRKSKNVGNMYESPIQEYNWEINDPKVPEVKPIEEKDPGEVKNEGHLSTIMEESSKTKDINEGIIEQGEVALETVESVKAVPETTEIDPSLEEPSFEEPPVLQKEVVSEPENETEEVLKTKELSSNDVVSDSEDEVPLAKLVKMVGPSKSAEETVGNQEKPAEVAEDLPEILEKQVDEVENTKEQLETISNEVSDVIIPEELVIPKDLSQKSTSDVSPRPKRPRRSRNSKKSDPVQVELQTEASDLKPNQEPPLPVQPQEQINTVETSETPIKVDEVNIVKPKKGRKRKSKTKPLEILQTTSKAIDSSTDKPSCDNKPKEEKPPEQKLQLSVYDFDEDDDGVTGDNSKENMEHTPKWHKAHLKATQPEMTRQTTHEEPSTPLKDVQNESFIQTPDLNDSSLVSKLTGRFKVRKCSKSGRTKKQTIPPPPEDSRSELGNYCDICNKQFMRFDSLNKHKRTLTHIAKLSEIEALEAEAKKKQKQRELEELKAKSGVVPNEVAPVEDLEETKKLDEETPTSQEDVTCSNDEVPKDLDDKEDSNIIQDNESVKDNLDLDVNEVANVEYHLQTLQIPVHVQTTSIPTSCTSGVISSPFSIKTNNDSLKLANIISDVLNKPVEASKVETKRCKSLGERKSFDSDSIAYTPTTVASFNISPASSLINKNKSDEFIKNQLSLLENIIEINKESFEYVDASSMASADSDKSVKSEDRCPSDMSLVSDSDIKPDNVRIISRDDEANFIKPHHQMHYEEISEDSMNNRNYDQERSRKTLNRDEELFLECCSLLKSSSELSNFSKKSSRAPPLVASAICEERIREEDDWMQDDLKGNSDDEDFLSDSCPNTPIGDNYDDFSNSDTIKTEWERKMDTKDYEDLSQSSEDNGITGFKAFDFKELSRSDDVEESSNSVDFRKNIDVKFGGIMAEALKSKSPKRKQESMNVIAIPSNQTSITDYTVQLKTSSNEDLTNDSRKMLTKGAMKVFEGLKVSIPTDELDLKQLLNCSPIAKRLELEESSKLNGKSKPFSFGNKLGLKVTKRRNQRQKPEEFHHIERDKIHDVYDFEETQDNTDLFTTMETSKLPFRNNGKPGHVQDDLEQAPKAKPMKEIDSESESNNLELDSFTAEAEAQSLNSFSTETESSTSIKPPNMGTEHENITKKKCVIMGRIFRNAFKAKVEENPKETSLPVTPQVEENEPLDSYIIGGPLETISTPPTLEKSPVIKERPKMTEKEMDLLFDTLLQGDPSKPALKPEDEQLPQTIKNPEVREQKDCKVKKSSGTPKLALKSNKKRGRKGSASSDDEFNLSKTPKKRQPRKNTKDKDNAINLEQELKECMGVASRKSQRKCTSGKQNVLIEDWSSDDSEFEAMLRLSMQDVKPKSTKTISINLQPSNEVIEPEVQVTRPEMKEDPLEEGFNSQMLEGVTKSAQEEIPKMKTKRSNSSANCRSPKRSAKRTKPATSCDREQEDAATVASNRRKRATAESLYYWSSSSEDDTLNLIEVKSVRDELDDEEERPQHGWIVGDSPKKLVTLLAHAKGKKTCNR